MHELCAACARLRCFSGLDLGHEQHSIEDESLNHEPSNTWKYKAEAESRKQDLHASVAPTELVCTAVR